MIDFSYIGHLVIGSITGLMVTHHVSHFIAFLLGSLLPDIDHKRSILGRVNPLTPWMRHRGHCHSLIGILILSVPFLYFNKTMYLLVVLGALSHLLGDKLFSWLPHKGRFKLKIW